MENPSWGRPPWRVDYDVPAASLPQRCEVAVVGAGLTGLAAAYELARRGIQVAVLEAGRIGDGSSGRTGGIVLEGTAAGDLQDAGDCISALRTVVEAAAIDCGLRVQGCYEIAHAAEPDGRLRWHDAGRTLCISRLVPGGTVDPGALLSGLARAAIEAGAAVHERAPVTAIERGKPSTLLVAGRKLTADQVVVALNAFTPACFSLPVRVQPALTLAVRTERLDSSTIEHLGIGDRRPFYTVDLPYLWGRLESEHLILGAGLVLPSGDDVRSVGTNQDAAIAAFERLEQRIRGFHPALARVAFDARWGGPVAFREGRAPILGRHPQAPNVIVTGAYAGHGIALSVAVGRLVADAITHDRPLPAWGAL